MKRTAYGWGGNAFGRLFLLLGVIAALLAACTDTSSNVNNPKPPDNTTPGGGFTWAVNENSPPDDAFSWGGGGDPLPPADCDGEEGLLGIDSYAFVAYASPGGCGPEDDGQVGVSPRQRCYAAGAQIAVKARVSADYGYTFIGWSEGYGNKSIISTDPSLTITVGTDKTQVLYANFEKLDGGEILPPPTTAPTAQYIRTSKLPPSDAGHPPITVVSARGELEQFYEEYHYQRFDGYGNPYPDKNFLDAIEKYSEAFFTDNSLIIVGLWATSGSIRHRVERIDENGDIVIAQLLPIIGTADVVQWHIIIEVDNESKMGQYQVRIVDIEPEY